MSILVVNVLAVNFWLLIVPSPLYIVSKSVLYTRSPCFSRSRPRTGGWRWRSSSRLRAGTTHRRNPRQFDRMEGWGSSV